MKKLSLRDVNKHLGAQSYFKAEAALSISWQGDHGLTPHWPRELEQGTICTTTHGSSAQYDATTKQLCLKSSSLTPKHMCTHKATQSLTLWFLLFHSEVWYINFAISLELHYQHSSYNSPTSFQLLLQTSWQHHATHGHCSSPLLPLYHIGLNASGGKTS